MLDNVCAVAAYFAIPVSRFEGWNVEKRTLWIPERVIDAHMGYDILLIEGRRETISMKRVSELAYNTIGERNNWVKEIFAPHIENKPFILYQGRDKKDHLWMAVVYR